MALIEIDDLFNKIETLPGIPEVIFHINDIDESEGDAASKLNALALESPGINERLLGVINSIYYSYPDPIASAEEAVNLLGFDLIRNLLLSTAFVGTFAPVSGSVLNHNMFWLHTAATAYICKNIAESRDDFSDGETRNLFLSALLHDLGILVLESCYPEAHRQIVAACADASRPYIEIEREVLQGMDHTVIGRMVAEHWKCPPFLVEAVSRHHDPDSCTVEGLKNFVNLFHVSHFIAEVTRIGHFKMTPTQPVSRNAIEALGLGNDFLKEEAMLILKRENEIRELLDTLLPDTGSPAGKKKKR